MSPSVNDMQSCVVFPESSVHMVGIIYNTGRSFRLKRNDAFHVNGTMHRHFTQYLYRAYGVFSLLCIYALVVQGFWRVNKFRALKIVGNYMP